jgi:DNA helicase II / ATP-dependent DNA helicase PcrA
MPVNNLEVSNKDISRVQLLLLSDGSSFDDERKGFIRNWETIDLQAVPGSGKTTLLLAKLIILEKNLPFEDNSGVLVISHTNSAIDEIKNKLGKHCHKLFSPPNYIGTIQTFVDKFLAIPYFSQKYKREHLRIDDEIYIERAQQFSRESFVGFSRQIQKQAKLFLHVHQYHQHLHLVNSSNGAKIIDGSTGKEIAIKNPRGNDWSVEEKVQIKNWIITLKQKLIEKGFLSYGDAYYLGFAYLASFPRIKKIMQKRFKYVFVDEMQDMDKNQYEILEQIFYNGGNSDSLFQRIGDQNQAIFGGETHLNPVWEGREKTLALRGSCRLTEENAKVVKFFALKETEIDGRGINVDGTPIGIKPKIILFNDNSITKVIPKFAEIIKSHLNTGQIPSSPLHVFKAIGWRKNPNSDQNLAISSYYPPFSSEQHKVRVDYPSLTSYLRYFDKRELTLERIRKNILNSFLRILRIEGVRNKFDYNYTKRQMINHLRENFPDFYLDLKLKIYQWSIGTIRGKADQALVEIKEFIPKLLEVFDSNVKESYDFINAISEPVINEVQQSQKPNTYIQDSIEIEITTVHAAKGQTHTATLFLETYFNKLYESERLCDCFKCINHNFSEDPNKDGQKKESLKISYVALSRPTHLLCVAIHKTRYDSHIYNLDPNLWDVITI